MQAFAVVLVTVTMVMALAVVLVFSTMVMAIAVVLMSSTMVIAGADVFHVPRAVMQKTIVVAEFYIVCWGSNVIPPLVTAMLTLPEQWRNYVQAILMAQ